MKNDRQGAFRKNKKMQTTVVESQRIVPCLRLHRSGTTVPLTGLGFVLLTTAAQGPVLVSWHPLPKMGGTNIRPERFSFAAQAAPSEPVRRGSEPTRCRQSRSGADPRLGLAIRHDPQEDRTMKRYAFVLAGVSLFSIAIAVLPGLFPAQRDFVRHEGAREFDFEELRKHTLQMIERYPSNVEIYFANSEQFFARPEYHAEVLRRMEERVKAKPSGNAYWIPRANLQTAGLESHIPDGGRKASLSPIISNWTRTPASRNTTIKHLLPKRFSTTRRRSSWRRGPGLDSTSAPPTGIHEILSSSIPESTGTPRRLDCARIWHTRSRISRTPPFCLPTGKPCLRRGRSKKPKNGC